MKKKIQRLICLGLSLLLLASLATQAFSAQNALDPDSDSTIYDDTYAVPDAEDDDAAGEIRDNLGTVMGDDSEDVYIGNSAENIDIGNSPENTDVGDDSEDVYKGDDPEDINIGDGSEDAYIGNSAEDIDIGNSPEDTEQGDGSDNTIQGDGSDDAAIGDDPEDTEQGDDLEDAAIGDDPEDTEQGDGSEDARKAELGSTLAEAQGYGSNGSETYSSNSWQRFLAARNSAQLVYDDIDAKQSDIDTALADLGFAMENLVAASPQQGAAVSTIAELKAALADDAVSTIQLAGDIAAPKQPDPKLVLSHSVDIYGEGYALDLASYSIAMESSGTLGINGLAMKTTNRNGFIMAYASTTSRAGSWDVAIADSSFEGSAFVGQGKSSSRYGMVDSVAFTGTNTVTATGPAANAAVVYAQNVEIGGSLTMAAENGSILFKSVNSSGVGSGTNAYGSFVVDDGANVELSRQLSSSKSNTYKSNLVEGYENHVFGENSNFSATAGTNMSPSSRCATQTAIIHSASAKEFTLEAGAKVYLVSDHSLEDYPATHGSTALSLRKPKSGELEITVKPGAVLDISAYGTASRSRSLAPVLIGARATSGNTGVSHVLVQGTLAVRSKNGNGWYYQQNDSRSTGQDIITVDGGEASIIADGKEGRALAGEYAALDHYGSASFSLEVENGGSMAIETNGWRAMSLASGVLAAAPTKAITVTGAGSELSLKGGQLAIAAEGKTIFELNVLDGGHASTWNTQSAGIYTTGQATYNIDGAGSRLEMVTTGVPEDSASKDKTSLYGVIMHDAPLVGPLTINVTDGAGMWVENSFGNRAAITAQSINKGAHYINVSGKGSLLSVMNNNTGSSASKNTSLYPAGAIAFAANCSGNITVSDGGNLFAQSHSPDSPTIALGGRASLSGSGYLKLDNAGEVDVRNNADTENARAIALRGRDYDPKTSNDTAPALTVAHMSLAVWPVGFGPQNWPDGDMAELWQDAEFTASNSAHASVAPGSLHGTDEFALSQYGRIFVKLAKPDEPTAT